MSLDPVFFLTILTLFLVIAIIIIGVIGITRWLWPYSGALVAFVKTPQGWRLRKLKIKDNNLVLDKNTVITDWSWDKAIDLVMRRWGVTKVYKALYIDPDAPLVLDPKSPGTIDLTVAKGSMLIGRLTSSILMRDRREKIILTSMTLITIALIAVIAIMYWQHTQTINNIVDKIASVIEYINKTSSIPPPPPG